MYHKDLDIFIQYFFSKFLFINKLYPLDGEQSVGGNIEPLDKFLLVKLNISIIEGKEKHF